MYTPTSAKHCVAMIGLATVRHSQLTPCLAAGPRRASLSLPEEAFLLPWHPACPSPGQSGQHRMAWSWSVWAACTCTACPPALC